MNMQSLNSHYLMRQQLPTVFLLLLVYLGAFAYDFSRNKFELMLAQGYLTLVLPSYFFCNTSNLYLL